MLVKSWYEESEVYTDTKCFNLLLFWVYRDGQEQKRAKKIKMVEVKNGCP